MEQTLHAMKKVSEIQSKRQEMFFKMRMRSHKVTQREIVRAEIKKGIEILVPAAADKVIALEKATEKLLSRKKVFDKKMTN